MPLLLDRNRLYVFLIALEIDLRDAIRAELLLTRSVDEVLGPASEKAHLRLQAEEERGVRETDAIDYLDLSDEIEILARWRAHISPSISESIYTNISLLQQLIPIRNRVMHGRPLALDDLTHSSSIAEGLEDTGFPGRSFREAIRLLRSDPAWSPASQVEPYSYVLNNLPLGDFDETGLIGRRKDLQKLKRQILSLQSARTPVLTVVGPGGVGKTALTLQALHDIVSEPGAPYDLIAWVSLKKERLTTYGIEAIHSAVLSIEAAVPVLVGVLSDSPTATVAELALTLEGLNALLVIDNLETVVGTEVLSLIDALPQSVSYLMTSRVGLGELERRFPLGPLETRYAMDLFRRLARARGVAHLATMTDQSLMETIDQLGSSPLALRWFITAVEEGAEPRELLRNRESLVRFCVENVLRALSPGDLGVAQVLHILARPVTVHEVHLHVPGISPDDLRRSLQALERRMLVRVNLIEGTITETFEATDVLSDYLKISEALDTSRESEIRRTDDGLRLAEERHRQEAAQDLLRPNVVQGGNEHRALILLLRDALSESHKGNVLRSLEIISEAEQLSPEYWEIFRVRGFILSSADRVQEATAAYEESMRLAPDDNFRAIVEYFFAGHLTRKDRDTKRALDLAEDAHRILGRDKTAVEFGRALVYEGQFDAGIEVLKTAITGENVKTRLIASTMLADAYKRRSEYEASVLRRPDKALQSNLAAVEMASGAIADGLSDRRLRQTIISCISECLRVACFVDEAANMSEVFEILEIGLDAIGSAAELRSYPQFGYLESHTRRLLRQRPEVQVVGGRFISRILDVDAVALEEMVRPPTSRLRGIIKAWLPDRHFGFVLGVSGDPDLYFNRSHLSRLEDEIHLRSGAVVDCVREDLDDGRARATDLWFCGEDLDSDLIGREFRVLEIVSNYLFAADTVSGATIFVGRHALLDQSEWSWMEPGFKLIGDVETDMQGRFRAVPGTVNVPLD